MVADRRDGGVALAATATLLPNGKVVVAGGLDADGNPGLVYRFSVEIYDPATGRWTAGGNMVRDRAYHTATLLGSGKILFAGGSGNGNNTAELYNPVTRTSTMTGSMSKSRTIHAATLLANGKVMVSGGQEVPSCCAFRTVVEIYDPATGTWANRGTLRTPRALHTATLLNNGKVLVAGGSSSTTTHEFAEVYDPATATSAFTGRMVSARVRHEAVKLGNGRVAVVGGALGGGAIRSVEVFNPATGTWSARPDLVTKRHSFTAALLGNGKILVAGGMDDSSPTTDSAELLQP